MAASEKPPAPVQLDIDRVAKRLLVTVPGGPTASLHIGMTQEFIAELTKCLFALVRITEGYRTNLPFDPQLALEPVAGDQYLAPYDMLSEAKVRTDERSGHVSLLIRSNRGGLTATNMEPAEAKQLAGMLAFTAERIGKPVSPS